MLANRTTAGPRFIGRVTAALAVVTLQVCTVTPAVPVPASGPAAAAPTVTPIRWQDFTRGRPTDPAALQLQGILGNATRYALGTWYPETFGDQTGEHLDLGGTGEAQIRPVASEALTLATGLRTGTYDPAVTGVPTAEAERIALRLVDSLAYRHTTGPTGQGWGNHWQSALWAYWAGSAGWFLWDDLTPDTRSAVARMVEHEADRFLGYDVPYYRDVTGDLLSPGDTKAEENAWNALVLQLATAMMPGHPHWMRWMDTAVELMVSSYARPQDVDSERRVNGKTVAQWLDGSNAGTDATVVNHNILHPEYQTPVSFNAAAVQSYTLAGMPTPEAAFFNLPEVYDSLVDVEFASPPHDAPGGTVYVPGSSDIYYPQGSDWGTGRRMLYAWLDTQAAVYGLDGLASAKAAGWAELHAGKVLQMQGRFTDGRTFGDWNEHRYAGREQFVAVQAAQAYLVRWIDRQGGMELTDRSYPVSPQEDIVGTLTLDLPDRLTPGRPVTVTTLFENDGRSGLRDAEVRLTVPAGWQVAPATRRIPAVRPGQVVRSTFEVTAPLVTGPGAIGATAGFTTAGQQRTVAARPKSAPLWAGTENMLLRVGEPDGASSEFALSPAGNLDYPTRFPDDVDVDVTAPDAAAGWSYILPGPRDRWAGSRQHPFTMRFTLDTAPAEPLVYTAWLVDTHYTLPPLVAVDVNGRRVAELRMPRGGGDGVHWGDGAPDIYGGVRPTSFGVALPAGALRAGENTITLTSLDGSWIVYDAFGIHRSG